MSLVPSHPTVSAPLPCLSGFLLSAVSPASHLTVDAGLPWSTVSVLPCPDLRTCLNLCTPPALPVASPEFSPRASLAAPRLPSVSGLHCLSAAPAASLTCAVSAPAGAVLCVHRSGSHRGSLHRSRGSFPQALDLLSVSLLDL